MAKTPLKEMFALNRWAEIVRSRFRRDPEKAGNPARDNARSNADPSAKPATGGKISGVRSLAQFIKRRKEKLPRLSELEERKRRLMMGGGEKAITAQHEKGKLTARERRTKEFREKLASPYEAAKLGLVDAVIQSWETRLRLLRVLEMLRGKRGIGSQRKHGNIPL